jgi:hypothetical protein
MFRALKADKIRELKNTNAARKLKRDHDRADLQAHQGVCECRRRETWMEENDLEGVAFEYEFSGIRDS